jgi:putative ABC transport system ATP-binding protein
VTPLQARGLHRFYRRGGSEVAALLDVSLTCQAGETVAVTGPSGSGKSTLLGLLAGLDDPDGGAVHVAGQRLSHQTPAVAARIRARHVGILTQSSGLFGHLSVLENVAFAASLRGGAGPSAAGASPGGPSSEELIEALGLRAVRRSTVRTLSGGETARAGLAVALAGAPMLLLADEPTAEVSRDEETTILDLLRAWRPRDGATVIVTHSASVAAYADRIVHLVDGRVA